MAYKKVGVTGMKLKVGASVEGYLVGLTQREFKGDDGAFGLCNVIIKTPVDIVSLWIQDNYFHVLKKGLLTKISKVETKDENGEKTSRMEVEQDESNILSTFDK